MKKSVFLDLKRLIYSRFGVAVLIFAPVIILLCFAAVIAPVYFSAGEGFKVALFCEDREPLTASIIQSLVETEKSRAVLKLENVPALEEGQNLLKEGAACLIHIPGDFQKNLMSGKKSGITIYENETKPLECAIVKDVLLSGVKLVNEAQGGVNALYAALKDKIPEEDAKKAYFETSGYFLMSALNKGAVFETETVSPLGALQPVEYYAAALFVIFLSLSSLSLYYLTTSDITNEVLSRHLSAGRTVFMTATPRVLSGAISVFLQGAPVLLLYLPVCITSFAYGGSVYLMPLCLITLAFLVSSFAYFMGAIIKGVNVKAVFLILAALLLIGGAIIPAPYFGRFAGIAAFTPFFAALKMTLDAFFFFEKGGFTMPFLICFAYAVLFYLAGLFAVRRRI